MFLQEAPDCLTVNALLEEKPPEPDNCKAQGIPRVFSNIQKSFRNPPFSLPPPDSQIHHQPHLPNQLPTERFQEFLLGLRLQTSPTFQNPIIPKRTQPAFPKHPEGCISPLAKGTPLWKVPGCCPVPWRTHCPASGMNVPEVQGL